MRDFVHTHANANTLSMRKRVSAKDGNAGVGRGIQDGGGGITLVAWCFFVLS